ncbi:nicotinate-nucleotide--dimethylbenzimidazole phosphoribosyltransferase, partial [Methylomonas koyamae]|uniref:nicotinate-nucleotide--dimethylbenzimidazole phosphoribosyltransferase n=1 Tax=Methylomonas koyamae TaxID=702114 RepID=UPI000AE45E09
SALAAACLQLPASEITGAGTGLLPEQIDRKAAVIAAALQSHRPRLDTPLAILQTLGGFEIAALAGAYIAAAQQGLPVLVDGFISSVAALLAARINPGCAAWFFFGHCSAEKGHSRVLQALNARPLLTMDMRLGEGSGAALAVPMLQMPAGCITKWLPLPKPECPRAENRQRLRTMAGHGAFPYHGRRCAHPLRSGAAP